MKASLQRFLQTIQQKLASHIVGQPEDQLRSPFERLLGDVGAILEVEVLTIGETHLNDGQGRPDFGVSANKLLCGYVELKAPGKGADTSKFRGHDKRQWERFGGLPNILYTDGREFAVYRLGVLQKLIRIEHDSAGLVSDTSIRQFELLISDFLRWIPDVPGSAKQLAQYLAPLCRMLRDDVLDALNHKAPSVTAAANDWRRYLFPGADDERFADAYAQTVTFALLLARSNGSDTLVLDEAIESLTHANTLLSRALRVLTDPLLQEHLGVSLGLLQRVIDRVPTGTMSGGRRDPWLHFYEDFLAEYDPALRKDAGAYYTPVEVVQAQVKIVDDLLRRKLGKKHGFATGGVNVLDPAVGTGTYLLGIIEHALDGVLKDEGAGAVPARADLLGSTLFGFEIMVGPYAVASLRLTRMLQQYGGHLPGDGAQVMLNNTLESPNEKIPELPLLYQPIGLEHKRAKRVKDAVPVLVCIGNPPYDRHSAATVENRAMTGAWVRWGEDKNGRDAILNDFIAPVRDAGKGSDLKNLYNLYVYFWRWALWKTFEDELGNGPGIVSYITASSFLDGDAFLGMRQHMRKLCDEIWVIDLGGEGRGTRKDENVFDIQTPVAITIAARYGLSQLKVPAKVHYVRLEGTRASKLSRLEELLSVDSLEFETCSDNWTSSFKPLTKGEFFSWPLMSDLMPWQQSGVKAGRTWVIAPDSETLLERYRQLVNAPAEQKAKLFKDSPTGRKTLDSATRCTPAASIPVSVHQLTTDHPEPVVAQIGFRSFDRQWILADGRFLDRPGPSLWKTSSPCQIYLTGLSTQPLSIGPALTVSPDVPDLHHFRGSFGGKDVFPLYRDFEAKLPNLHPRLIAVMEGCFGNKIAIEDMAAYLYGVVAHPYFTSTYHEELLARELRVPITLNFELFERGVNLGRELLYLHTYGERFSSGQQWPVSKVKSIKAISPRPLPEHYSYDDERQTLVIGDGELGPLSRSVYDYEVSGHKVVQSWISYRLLRSKGKKSSPLDDESSSAWGADFTSELLRLLNILSRTLEISALQAELLDEIVKDKVLSDGVLGEVPSEWRAAPKYNLLQPEMTSFESD